MSISWTAFLAQHRTKSVSEQFNLYQELHKTGVVWTDLHVSQQALWLDNYATAPMSAAVH